MPHVRTQIRQAVRAALIAGGTSAGANVFDARVRPLQASELPAIIIEDGEEQSDPDTLMSGPIERLDRDYALRVNAIVTAANEDHAALLDDLCAQIETIVARDCFNAGGAQFIYPTGFTPTVSDEGEYTVARGTLEFKARYGTSQLDPTQIR